MQMLKELMSHDVHVIGPNSTIREAAQQMLKGNFGMLPVGENDRMIGAISDRDIVLRAVAEGLDSTTKVRAVMSDGVVWAALFNQREDSSGRKYEDIQKEMDAAISGVKWP